MPAIPSKDKGLMWPSCPHKPLTGILLEGLSDALPCWLSYPHLALTSDGTLRVLACGCLSCLRGLLLPHDGLEDTSQIFTVGSLVSSPPAPVATPGSISSPPSAWFLFPVQLFVLLPPQCTAHTKHVCEEEQKEKNNCILNWLIPPLPTCVRDRAGRQEETGGFFKRWQKMFNNNWAHEQKQKETQTTLLSRTTFHWTNTNRKLTSLIGPNDIEYFLNRFVG